MLRVKGKPYWEGDWSKSSEEKDGHYSDIYGRASRQEQVQEASMAGAKCFMERRGEDKDRDRSQRTASQITIALWLLPHVQDPLKGYEQRIHTQPDYILIELLWQFYKEKFSWG